MNVIVNLKMNYLTLGTTFKFVTLPTSESSASDSHIFAFQNLHPKIVQF